MPRQRMTISWDDLKSENVEKKLQQQQAISQARDHYENAQIQATPSRKPRFTFIYNTVFYMGLFGALGGLVGWGFGILLHLRPNAQQEARNLISSYEQFEHQAADGLATPQLLEAQLRGLSRDGRENEYFQLYLKHRKSQISEEQYIEDARDLANRDDWKNFIANLLFYGIAGMMIASSLVLAQSTAKRHCAGAV